MKRAHYIAVSLLMASSINLHAAQQVPAKSPEQGGPRNWVTKAGKPIPLLEEAKTKAKIIKRFKAGTVFDNLGCQTIETKTWCDVQPLGGGPRGFVDYEQLSPAVSPDGAIATGEDDSAMRAAEGKFDATGSVPCAQSKGQPMGQCQFGVARAGGGYATVSIQRSPEKKRNLYFRMGKPIGADGSEAEGFGKFKAKKQNDLHMISVGDERYEIPDAVVFGG